MDSQLESDKAYMEATNWLASLAASAAYFVTSMIFHSLLRGYLEPFMPPVTADVVASIPWWIVWIAVYYAVVQLRKKAKQNRAHE